MKSITLIMKVTSGCNLRCPYCYTKHTLEKKEVMPIETFEKAIMSIATSYDDVTIIFHGGEPLLVDLDWYKEAVSIMKRYKKLFGFSYNLSLQSNATLLNDEVNNFLKQEKINMGWSFDGTNNHKTRKNTDLVLENKKKYSAMGGCICLITKDNYLEIEKEIDYFDEIGIEHKFNIVFNTTTEVEDDLTNMSKEGLLNCYIKAFEHVIKKEESTSEDMFDKWLKKIFKLQHNGICVEGNCSGRWLSIHSNGSIYPCGQEWDNHKDYYYGNINDLTIEEVFETDKYKNFDTKFKSKIQKCSDIKCIAFDICNGGCPGENIANGKDIDSFIAHHCYLNKNILIYFNDFFSDENNLKKIYNKYIMSLYNDRRVDNE